MALEIFHGAQSDVGRKRGHNEDRYFADPRLGLFIVCDGVGGGNAGEVASALAVETIHRHYADAMQRPELPFVGELVDGFSPTTNCLASAIKLANDVIYKSGGDHPEWSGMGTTVIAAALTDHILSFAHVGDSRLYLFRNQTIQPLTTDHSWVAEQVRQGQLTEEEAERSPRRNIVTRALGAEAAVDIALGEVPLFPGDLLLLCSDGLTKGVKPSTILDTFLNDTEDAQTLSRRLITLANKAGGEDNTTVIVLAIREQQHQGLWQRLRQRLAM